HVRRGARRAVPAAFQVAPTFVRQEPHPTRDLALRRVHAVAEPQLWLRIERVTVRDRITGEVRKLPLFCPKERQIRAISQAPRELQGRCREGESLLKHE